MEFTLANAEMLIAMDERLSFILKKLDHMEEKIDKNLNDHECRIREIEIHGSQKVLEAMSRLDEVEHCVDKVTHLVDYERGRLAIIFIAVGSFISAAISYWISRT
jgi:tetrahydromethanopterin S-methyltransferase subunit G